MSRLLPLFILTTLLPGQISFGQERVIKTVPLEELRERAALYFSTPEHKAQLVKLGVAEDYSGISSDGTNLVWLYRVTRDPENPEAVREELQKLCLDMLRNTAGRDPINVDGLTISPVIDTSPAVLRSLFVYPQGLSLPPEQLFASLGHWPGYSVPMTAEYCFDLAYACWIRGNAADAVILAKHGLERRNDARLHLLLGVCLLELNRPQLAEATAQDFRNAVAARFTYGLNVARERVNGPLRTRFDTVVEYQALVTPLVPTP